MNLGEAIEIARSRMKRPPKNKGQRDYLQRKMQEPGWWERQLKLQNERRRKNGVL